jgi:PAS domain S-box-containing protein
VTSSYLKIRRRIRSLVALFLALILIALGSSVYLDYREKTGELFKESQSHVRIIADHASRSFGEVDRVLDIVLNRTLTPDIRAHVDEKKLYSTFLSAREGTPQVVSVFYVNAGGLLSASSLKYPINKLNVRDREYFRHHHDTPGGAPFISRPFKSRVTNKWNFVFSKRISNPDGSFAGIIGATLEMGYFESLYGELFNDTSRTVALVREDGFPVVMYPPQETSLSVARTLFRHLPDAPAGMYRDKDGDNDGSDVLISYCKLSKNYPLVAYITYDWNTSVAAWKREALVKTILVVLFSVLVIVITRSLVRRLHDLDQSEEKRSLLAQIVDQSPVSVVVTDPDGTISYVNPCFKRLTGYSAEEAIGNNPRILKTEFTSPGTFPDMWSKLYSGQEWSGELCNKKKDGSLYWEMAHLFPVIDGEGTITHFAAVKEDITERKQVEEELQRAKKVAEAANNAKSEFLANMSHEIRTPMNAITGMAYLALQTDLDAQQRDYVGKVLGASESLLGIINDILDFSKIEAGKLDLEEVTFDLSEVLGQVDNIMVVRAEEKGIGITSSLSPDVPRMLIGDPLRLRQILINLAGNSVKFTEQGEVLVVVNRARRTAAPGRVALTFSVTDTGIGMDDEQIGRIFAPFCQVDSSIARRYGGTGLGLSIVKRLVDLMGGVLEVVSQTKQGSSFSFTIELGLASEEAKAGTALLLRLPEGARSDLNKIKGAHILLVEDDPTNQQVAREILQQAGMVVELAVSGRQALDLIENGRTFDLVFMDIQMPDMDGFEITGRIRRQRRIDELPIVAMTAHTMSEVREKCLEAGMNGHVSKPINPLELFAALVRWIRSSDAAHTEATDTEATEMTTGENSVFPASLPGINLPVVLERIGGDKRLLQRLLAEFREQHLNCVAEIRMAIKAFDLVQARRIVHNLKGVTGNLGAESVFAMTRKIEGALLDNNADELTPLLDQLQKGMDEVFASVRELERIMPRRKTCALPGVGMPLAKDELVQRLNRLAELLRRNKATATKYFKEMRPYLPDSPELFALEEQIDRLDFKKGLHSLKQIAQELNVPLKEQS